MVLFPLLFCAAVFFRMLRHDDPSVKRCGTIPRLYFESDRELY